MGATYDAVEKIGGIIKSLIAAFMGEEPERSQKYTRPRWQTTEEKEHSARRLALLRRRMAHCDRATSATADADENPDKV